MAGLINPLSCTDSSAAAHESIVGSGTAGVSHWILLEYAGRWEPKAWEHADVGDRARAHVDAALAATPNSRLQLIRRFDSCDGGALRLFIADTRPGGERVHCIQFSDYDALVDLDLTAALAGDLPTHATAMDALYLVCTHGKRDQCCALYGQSVYRALGAVRPLETWQSSHLGGHRFAPTAMVFPQGFHLGRLQADDMLTLADAHDAGRLHDLKTLRGRTAYPPAAQAAESLVRARDSRLGYGDVIVESFQRVDVTRWTAGLIVGGQRETVSVTATREATPIHKSCAKPDTTFAWSYSLAPVS